MNLEIEADVYGHVARFNFSRSICSELKKLSKVSFFTDSKHEIGKFRRVTLNCHVMKLEIRMLRVFYSTGWPVCEVALQELRRLIYQIVLDRSDNHVIEYGRVPYEELKNMKV